MKTIFTTLRSIADADLVRNKNQYTVDLEKVAPNLFMPEHIIEVIPDKISPRESFAWISSPQGYGPPHQIKLSRGRGFALTRKEFLMHHVDYPIWHGWYLWNTYAILVGREPPHPWERATTMEDLFQAFDELEAIMPRIKKFIQALREEEQKEKTSCKIQ